MTGFARTAVVALVLCVGFVAHAADELSVAAGVAYVAPARVGLAFEARGDLAAGVVWHGFVRGDGGASGLAGVSRVGLGYAYDVIALVPFVQGDVGVAFDFARSAALPSYGVGLGLRHYVSMHTAVELVGGCEWLELAPRFVLRLGVAFD